MDADGFAMKHATYVDPSFAAEPLRGAPLHQPLNSIMTPALRLFMTFVCVVFLRGGGGGGGEVKNTLSSFDCVRLKELHQTIFPGMMYSLLDIFLSCVSAADNQSKIACAKILGPSSNTHNKVGFTALRVLT